MATTSIHPTKTAPSDPPPTSHPSPREISVLIYRSLEMALTKEYARRYDAGVVLHRTEDFPEDGSKMHIRVDYQGMPELAAELSVSHTGHSTYDVFCAVEDGNSRRFSYSVPRQTGPRLSLAPVLGETIARFLLEELEKRLGRLILDDSNGELETEV